MPTPLLDLSGMGGLFGAQQTLKDYIARQAAQGQMERQAMLDNMELQRQQRTIDLAERRQGDIESQWAEGAEGRAADTDYRIAAANELRGRPEAETTKFNRELWLAIRKASDATDLEKLRASNETQLAGTRHDWDMTDAEKKFYYDMELAKYRAAHQGGGAGTIRVGQAEDGTPIYLHIRGGEATPVTMGGQGTVGAPGPPLPGGENGVATAGITPGGAGIVRAIKPVPAGLETLLAKETNLVKNLGEIGGLFDKVNPMHTGPLAGRVTSVLGALPGVPRDQADADLDASLAVIKNDIIPLITGAAVRKDEEVRILKEIPTRNDKPEDRAAKTAATAKNAHDLANIIRKRYGLGVGNRSAAPGGGGAPSAPDLIPDLVFDPATGTFKKGG